MMPGLPSMTPAEDISDFKKLFSDPELRPDMLKIYPTLVLEDTPLYSLVKEGRFTPYSEDEMVKVLTEIKKIIPRWARIMRVQREIYCRSDSRQVQNLETCVRLYNRI